MNYLRIKHGDYKTLKKRPAAKRAFCRQNWAIKPSCLTRHQAYAPLATRGATQARGYCSLDFQAFALLQFAWESFWPRAHRVVQIRSLRITTRACGGSSTR